MTDDGCIMSKEGEREVNQYPEKQKQKQTFYSLVLVGWLGKSVDMEHALWLDCLFHNARQPGEHFVFPRMHILPRETARDIQQ